MTETHKKKQDFVDKYLAPLIEAEYKTRYGAKSVEVKYFIDSNNDSEIVSIEVEYNNGGKNTTRCDVTCDSHLALAKDVISSLI